MEEIPAADHRGERTASQSTWKRFYRVDELAAVPCPGCGSSAFEDVAREFGITISRCCDCRLVYTRTPLPNSQSHYVVAKDEYLAKYGEVFSGKVSHQRDRNYDEQLRLLEQFRRPGDLLDIGTHCGFFLRRARERGWRTTG